MEKFDKFCQSCGMPIEKDTEHGGTNADGSKTLRFCSRCYTRGHLMTISPDQMKW